MSFLLPGNARQLRFAPDANKPRVRAPLPPPRMPARKEPSVRPTAETFSDENPTTSLDRHALAALGTPFATRAPKRTTGLPYPVWIVAGILAGGISYFVAPEVIARAVPTHASRSAR